MGQSFDVTRAIVKTVADYENTSPEQLPPLEDKIDAETFQQLSPKIGELTEPLHFEYLWYEVTVLPDGEVIVTP